MAFQIAIRFLALCLGLVSLLGAEDENLREGHSHQGESFDEGPRQAGVLMGNTGKVHLKVTTKWAEGQAFFDQGLGQLHGFWYYEAERSFRQVLANDPDCLMAYWGLAMANYENPKRAKKLLETAAGRIGEAVIAEHEKAYLRAMVRFYDEEKVKDQTQRNRNFLKDLEDLSLDYPEDLEAKAIYVCRSWQFGSKGVPIASHIGLDAILEKIFAKNPDHPAHHFAIHLWDSRRAAEALDSAAKLGRTAPGIAHMWHMPGHIYSKEKRYEDSAWHQQASARIDHAHMAKAFLLPDQIHNYAHNNEWLARNFATLGRPGEAIEMAKSLLANPRHPKYNTAAKGSMRYGRLRLIEFLEDFELWEEAAALVGTPWLERLEDEKAEVSRLRLMGLADFHLGHEGELESVVGKLEEMKASELGKQVKAGETARKKAEKDGKSEKEVDALVRKARAQFDREIKDRGRPVAELRGYLAELRGEKEEARKAIDEKASAETRMMRYFSLGDDEKAAELARDLIGKKDRQCPPLAKALFVLHQVSPEDEVLREGFEDLRAASSRIELDSPIFARLAPLAEALGLPEDWRKESPTPTDILPRPALDELGALHWKPPVAPEFSLPDEVGKTASLADFRGKPVIVVFYLGAGCLHCAEQLTAIANRYGEFEKAGLPILAISTDEVEKLRLSREAYVEEGNGATLPFRILSDAPGEVFRAFSAYDDFENQPLHGTFVLDGEGRMRWWDVSAEPFMDLDFLIGEAGRLLALNANDE